jgi:hypothetical protein
MVETALIILKITCRKVMATHGDLRDIIQVGDRVRIFLDSTYWKSEGWFEGTVRRIDPYSGHRSFYWVELDTAVQTLQGGERHLVSVLNPARIEKV